MQPSPPASWSSTLAARSSPATTTTRRAVLFPASTSSASPSSFLAAGNSRLPRRLNEDDSVWDHPHDPEEAQAPNAEEDAVEGDAAVVLQPVAGRKRKKRPKGPAVDSDEGDGGDSSDSRNQRKCNSAGRGKVRRSTSTRHRPRSNPATLPVPSLPQPNDRFSSFVAFHQATIRAIVPVYGCGVTKSNVSSLRGGLKCQHYCQPASGAKRCPFELVVRRAAATDEYVVSTELSKYAHNHPPRAEILADPTWRPKLLNKDARAALGMSPTKWGSAKEAKETWSVMRTADVPKTETADERSREERWDDRNHVPPPSFSAPVSASPPLQSFSSHALPQLRPPDPPLPSHPSASHYPEPHAEYSWTQFSRSRSAFPHQPVTGPSFSHYSPDPAQLGASAPPQPRLASSRAPLTDVHLATFLASLHRSLAPLAPNFLATGGFSSLDSHSSLTLLEPESIEAVVELLKIETEDERTRPPGGARIGVVQAGLLAKGSREAGSVSVA